MPQPVADALARLTRQHEVEQDEIDTTAGQFGVHLPPACREPVREATFPQYVGKQPGDPAVIFNDQYRLPKGLDI